MEVNENSNAIQPYAVNTSTNITADEIDQETANKLRGDAIGDTMYSEVFVLNTLLQFSELQWSAEVEDNLCFLWDMTEEKDVCQYLFKVSYPRLACSAIINYNEPRFIEIVVGIFANLLCSKCEKDIKEDEIKTVLNLLSSSDPYILVQVMRFLHAVSFIFDKLDFIEDEHLDKFNFILLNSTNKELLAIALKTLSSITENAKINENVIKGELVRSSVTAYRAFKVGDRESEFEEFESQEQRLNIKYLIQLVCNICCYIDNLKVSRLEDEINSILHDFTNEMELLLNYFTREDNLLPVDEEFRFYIEALTYIYRKLSVNYISTIAVPLCKIYLVLSTKDSSNLEFIAELLCYFISVVREDADLPLSDVKDVLLDIDKNAFKFEFEYMDNLKKIVGGL